MKNKILKIFGITLILFGLSSLTFMFYLRVYYRKINQIKTYNIVSKVETETTEQFINMDKVLDREDLIEKEDNIETQLDLEEGVAILLIESCNINTIITEGVESKQLKYSIGHFPKTPMPEEGGNFVLAGHSSVLYDRVLNGIHDINIGDEITVITDTGTFRYFTSDKYPVAPTATHVLNNTIEDQITIVTCTDNGNKRFIIEGQREKANIADTSEIEVKVEGVENSRILSMVYSRIKGYKALVPLTTRDYRSIEAKTYKATDIKVLKVSGRQNEINKRLFEKLGRDRYIRVILP